MRCCAGRLPRVITLTAACCSARRWWALACSSHWYSIWNSPRRSVRWAWALSTWAWRGYSVADARCCWRKRAWPWARSLPAWRFLWALMHVGRLRRGRWKAPGSSGSVCARSDRWRVRSACCCNWAQRWPSSANCALANTACSTVRRWVRCCSAPRCCSASISCARHRRSTRQSGSAKGCRSWRLWA